MPEYAWVCHSCKNTNRPGSEICQVCGFPAVATGNEIQEAITGIKRPLRQSRKEFVKERRKEIAALPLWKKLIAYGLRAAQFIGAIIFWGAIFQLSLPLAALGFGVVIGAELIYQWVKGQPYAWQKD